MLFSTPGTLTKELKIPQQMEAVSFYSKVLRDQKKKRKRKPEDP